MSDSDNMRTNIEGTSAAFKQLQKLNMRVEMNLRLVMQMQMQIIVIVIVVIQVMSNDDSISSNTLCLTGVDTV